MVFEVYYILELYIESGWLGLSSSRTFSPRWSPDDEVMYGYIVRDTFAVLKAIPLTYYPGYYQPDDWTELRNAEWET